MRRSSFTAPHARRVAFLAATVLAMSGAVAAGAPARAASAGGPEFVTTVRVVAEPETRVASRSIVEAAAAPDGSVVRTVPAEPDDRARECLASPGVDDAGGLFLNRFVWCQRLSVVFDVHARVVTGPIVASMDLSWSAVAYGRDDGRRNAVMFFKLDDYTISPPVEGNEYITPTSKVEVQVCRPSCGFEGGTAKLPAQWTNGWARLGDIASSAAADGVGRDRVEYEQWHLLVDLVGLGPSVVPVTYEGPTALVRCDSAQYFGKRNKGAACIHASVTPNLRYSTQDVAIKGVAEHLRCAFDQSCTTYPDPDSPGASKIFPGDYGDAGRDAGALALHRIVANNSNEQFRLNRSRTRSACDRLPKTVYDPTSGPEGNKQQCDEYPFASTAEGAANGQDFALSLRGVPARENGCAGNDLKRFLRLDRILQDDPGLPGRRDGFYVNIVDTPAPARIKCTPDDDVVQARVNALADGDFEIRDDWTFVGDDEPEPVNDAPTVDAGPDVEGAEGGDIALTGSASDDGGDPDLRWTYAAVSGADAGARCSFGSTTRAATTFTCTDDGVYRVTLRADDGTRAVSDAATVTVTNAAPVFAAAPAAPKAWQVFPARTEVSLDAGFGDGGSNDTHTCTTNWDDGSAAAAYDADGTSCAAAHTFARAGMYTIRTTAVDDDGARSAKPAEVLVVVYDRSGGPAADVKGIFPTPAGAVVARPAASGSTTILAKSAYLPTGAGPRPELGLVDVNLLFQPFTLHTDPVLTPESGIDWLVVTPEGRVAIKGTARVNGVPRYGFVLYSWRGSLLRNQPTRLRLVSWPLSEGDNPSAVAGSRRSYDNNPGASLDLDDAPPPPVTLALTLTLTLPTGGEPSR